MNEPKLPKLKNFPFQMKYSYDIVVLPIVWYGEAFREFDDSLTDGKLGVFNWCYIMIFGALV